MQQDGTKRQMDQAVLKGQMDYLHSKIYVYRFRLHLNRAGCPFWATLALRLRQSRHALGSIFHFFLAGRRPGLGKLRGRLVLFFCLGLQVLFSHWSF
jgi:hypothetical protein